MDGHDREPLQQVPELPIPISLVAGRYLLFDVDAAIYLRRAHNICGSNIGTLHMIPSQNGFLGLPIILMPEEAQLLVDQGVGYILDDARAHDRAVYKRDKTRAAAYQADVHRRAGAIRDMNAKEQVEKKRAALANLKGTPESEVRRTKSAEAGDLLEFDDADPSPSTAMAAPAVGTYSVTPTSSQLLLPPQPSSASEPRSSIPNVSSSYPLFRHLNSRGYFMTPGLRFGCQYTTYPGDPLRFHSHFLTTDFGWDKQINLMDVVGGGRLGTGVKKGFLVGGNGPFTSAGEVDDTIRTFSIEWAVM